MKENIITTIKTTINNTESVVESPPAESSESNHPFGSMIEDNFGGVSSIRILMLMWGLGVFLVWGTTIVALFNGIYVIPSLPSDIIAILLGLAGIKTVQRFGEK